MTSPDYTIGDSITYIAMGGERRTGIVIERHANVKNGDPGFDMIEDGTGEGAWGYDEDILSVRRAAR